MASEHVLKFQCSIPASATRTPRQRLEKVVGSAFETLCRMVPNAYEIERKWGVVETKNRVGMEMWHVMIAIQFKHRGPLPTNVNQLKQFALIRRQLREGRGN